ncbi:conjugal transfer protein TraG N-terminal domain-containing protein, partial [Proteus mirabilis]
GKKGTAQGEKKCKDIHRRGPATLEKGEKHKVQSGKPGAGLPGDGDRDGGYGKGNGNGYPTCYQWWNDANAGLLKLVKEQTDEGMWLRARAAMKLINKNSKEFE